MQADARRRVSGSGEIGIVVADPCDDKRVGAISEDALGKVAGSSSAGAAKNPLVTGASLPGFRGTSAGFGGMGYVAAGRLSR